MQKKFKLQKVREDRELTLEREKAEVAELAAQGRIFINEVQRITGVIQQKYAEMAEAQNANDFAMTQMYEKYLKVLLIERRTAQQRLAEHRRLVQQQKQETVEAYKNKSIMDKLETRHKKAYALFMDMQEQKTLEDIVTTRAGSARGGD